MLCYNATVRPGQINFGGKIHRACCSEGIVIPSAYFLRQHTSALAALILPEAVNH